MVPTNSVRFPTAADAVLTSGVMTKLDAVLRRTNKDDLKIRIVARIVAGVAALAFATLDLVLNTVLFAVKAPFAGFKASIGRLTGLDKHLTASIFDSKDFWATKDNIRRSVLIQWHSIAVISLVQRPSEMRAMAEELGLIVKTKERTELEKASAELKKKQAEQDAARRQLEERKAAASQQQQAAPQPVPVPQADSSAAPVAPTANTAPAAPAAVPVLAPVAASAQPAPQPATASVGTPAVDTASK